MAPTFVSILHVIVLAAVVTPGLARRRLSHPSGSTLPDGYVAHPDIGGAYKVYDERVTWEEARRQCVSEGARLADMDTNIEYAYLTDQVFFGWAWTSIRRSVDQEWISTATGTISGAYILGATGGSPFDDDYNCVQTSPHLIESCGRMYTAPCDATLPYICKLPIPANYNA